MIDPRISTMLLESGTPTSQADACDALIRGAEALAGMSPGIQAGEARVVLALLVSQWEHKPPGDYQEKVALWVPRQAEVIQSQMEDTSDELRSHITAQASGAYALAPWPWPMLTEYSRSLMPGSVTLICGSPGASKSWFALSCLRHWTTTGIDSAVLMLEETRKWHLQRALAQCSGRTDMLKPEWIEANRDEALAIWEKHRDELALVRNRLVCEGNWTMRQCAEWVEKQCKERKRIIIVDPISLADNGGESPWDADRKFMARAKVAVEKSGTSLVLVTHPRKTTGGKGQGQPQLDDLAGGAAYGRACASALWISAEDKETVASVIGPDEHYMEARVHKTARILKARNGTGCGRVVAFQFRDLSFDELGVIAPRTERAPKSNRGQKLRQQPNPSEDKFP